MVFKRKTPKTHKTDESGVTLSDAVIDLDAPAPPQDHEEGVARDPRRRELLGKGLLALTAGLAGADIGARIRKVNDREATTNAVNGLVAEARRTTARKEQILAMDAMLGAQTLMSGLRRARGQTTLSGHVLDGSVTWQSKDGPTTCFYPVVFANSDKPSDWKIPRWVATYAVDQGEVFLNLIPVGDDAEVALNGRDPLLPVNFYTTSENKGGGDEYHAKALWATVDGQTAWREPGMMSFPQLGQTKS